MNDRTTPVESKPAAAPIDEPTIPAELHHDTAKLVRRFARALANKLLAAQRKYGYSDNWMRDGWADECRAELMRHIQKGDPRDVAAYCAFLWHHNESTTPAPSPADERVAFERHQGYPRPEYDGAAQEAWDYHRKTWLAALAFARASSANETEAEVAAVAWMRADDPRDCISDAKKRDMIEHAGAPGARLAENYSIALGKIAPVQAAEPVAEVVRERFAGRDRWDFKIFDRTLQHGAKLYAAPQPPAQAHAREVLTDEQREALQHAINAAEEDCAYTTATTLRTIIAAHPGQLEPIAWESTTVAYTKYITDRRYQKFSPEVRKWYKPYRCTACSESRAEVTGWQPIETAPSDKLVIVFWLDSDDEHNPERYDFDMLDDGCWRQWTDHYEWAHSVAPAGSRLPREQAPYTHWKPLGSPVPTDAARTGASS
ncbi:hypothetical protein [Burkholderia cenocepacia]|uniref:hypothetical protein n=1 Tax=Burkholderia cenocepacia TaxID=95486 RepID=UPI002B25590B|nr:hypothetical protein [Burkholderia cenocepacia]MEB2544318.1 hypothetical protein [Burkholderia cenocepacia]